MPNKLVKVTGPDGNSVQLSVPESIIDEKGNVKDDKAFESIADAEFAKTTPPKEKDFQLANRERVIPAMDKTINPYPSNPLSKGLESAEAIAGGRYKQAVAPALEGAGETAGMVSLAALPELKAAAIPRILASAAASYGAGKVAELPFSDPDNKRLAGDIGNIVGGAATMSPKITGAVGGALKNVGENLYRNPLHIMGLGAVDTMGARFGVPKPALAALNAAALAKPAYEGAVEGARGKPWVPSLFRNAVGNGSGSRSSGKSNNTVHDAEFVNNTKQEGVDTSKKIDFSKDISKRAKQDTEFFNKKELPEGKKASTEFYNKKELEAKGTKQIESSKQQPNEKEVEKEVIPQSLVEKHANENGISVDDAKKAFEGKIIKNKAEMMRALHARAEAKGVNKEDLKDIANYHFKADGLSKLTDAQIHEIWKNLGELPDSGNAPPRKGGIK